MLHLNSITFTLTTLIIQLQNNRIGLYAGAAPLGDLVEILPDYGRPPSTQFSGYLDASAGCSSHNGPVCKIHYWFALSSLKNWQNAPVILWLNGGPGSSSVIGFLQENGPLLINATGGLHDNPWSWTNVANFLVIETPIGVGYSYCSRQMHGKSCINSDRETAQVSRAAVVDFFTTKFPELQRNPFFITGESYAGVYIPMLAKQLFDHQVVPHTVNLMGLAVGDPCTDNESQAQSMDSLWYAYKYGLVEDSVFDSLWNVCKVRLPRPRHRTTKSRGSSRRLHITTNETVSLWDHLVIAPPESKANQRCLVAFRRFLLSSSHGLSQSWDDIYVDDYSLFAPVSNQQDNDMALYMMRSDVRQALHVEEAPTGSWPDADAEFHYRKQYQACFYDADPEAPSMIDFYRYIIPKLAITWFYNGDTDPCISWEGTRQAVQRIGYGELEGGGYRPWFYHQDAASVNLLAAKAPLFGPNLLAQDMGIQLGGEVVNFEHGLSFLTVHGAGHMVPQFRPQAALHMITRFVSFQPLTPLMPSDIVLAELSPEDFKATMHDWTQKAKAFL